MRFYLGTHQTDWLKHAGVPLFVSRRRLALRKKLPRAAARWALDSGGFSELSMHGRWQTSAAQYVAEVRRFSAEVGLLDWAAIQDWMCEPHMLKLTGKTIAEHQRLTIASYHELRQLAPEIPWAPVLQGWRRADYLRCWEAYARGGVDLLAEPIVGLGSVCRRQGTGEAEGFIRELAGAGLKLHGFGFKMLGLLRVGDALASSDSLAWSFHARKRPPLPGCVHRSCANCRRYALRWRDDLQGRLDSLAVAKRQLRLC